MPKKERASGRGSTPRSPRGRPSVARARREQIVSAFVDLIGEFGLEGVTIDSVADRARVSRTAVRHFAGNRADLIVLALDALADRFETSILARTGPEPDAVALVRELFGDAWVAEPTVEDRAFGSLQHEALRDAETRPLIRAVYERLILALTSAMRRSGAKGSEAELRDAAYLIVCLSEHNVLLQAAGYPRARSKAAAKHAFEILDRVLHD